MKIINDNFSNCLWKFVIRIFGKTIFWLWTLFSFENYFKLEKISGLDRNSNMPFLRNEFSKIFEDLLRWINLQVKWTHESFLTAWMFMFIFEYINRSNGELTLAKSTNVLAWSFNFLCSILYVRSLNKLIYLISKND